jgi:hypothetical protein
MEIICDSLFTTHFPTTFSREPVQSLILTTPRQNTYFPVRMSGPQSRSGTQSRGGCTHEMGRAICNLQSKEEQIYVCFTTLYLNPTPFPRTKQDQRSRQRFARSGVRLSNIRRRIANDKRTLPVSKNHNLSISQVVKP